MPRLIVVRHAMPCLDASTAPSEWVLSAEGRTAATALADRLPPGAYAVASSEVKARETLELALGRRVDVDARLDEVRRPVEPIGEGVRARRRAWVAGCLDGRHDGWERPGDAASRFEDAVQAAPAGDVIVATHGMVLSAWLVARGAVTAGEEAARFWESLRFPDVVDLDRGVTRGEES